MIGLAVARRLAQEGMHITLLERGECGRESSWAGAGVAKPSDPRRDDAVARLRARSLQVYAEFCAAVREESGVDPQYDACGEMELLLTQNSFEDANARESAAAGRNTPDGQPQFELHAPEKTHALEPAVAPNVFGALECRSTLQVRSPRLLAGLIEACRRAGVEIRQSTHVRDFLVDAGRVVGISADAGEIAAGKVVLCAGAWSSQIGLRLHSLMPVHPVRGQIVLIRCEHRPFRRVISHGKTYLVPRRDGHVLLGSTEEPEAGFQKRNTAQATAFLTTRAMELVPALERATIVATWSGLRPGTPDDLPYLGFVPGIDGLIAATGHYRSGLALAPVTAEIVRSLMCGREYDIDISPCRPGRG